MHFNTKKASTNQPHIQFYDESITNALIDSTTGDTIINEAFETIMQQKPSNLKQFHPGKGRQ